MKYSETKRVRSVVNESCDVHIIKSRRVVSNSDSAQAIGQVEITDTCRGCDAERTLTVSRAAHVSRKTSGVWMSASP